ncbi:MAG: phage tail sheath protein [Candidatus Eremiobacteraeota bacterium]|nr:phage tail sheath protein [Candidatus Eremiobacteraeota bacterium]
MAEMILPGTYIDVRPEGLIAPGQITVGNIGVVGTAAKGPIGVPQLLGSMPDALATFGAYDSWIDPATNAKRTNELTLVRALEQAFDQGGTIVYAVRVATNAAAKATYAVQSASGTCATLTAASEGTWANVLGLNVAAAAQDAYIQNEVHGGAVAPIALKYTPKQSARNRVTHHIDATGVTRQLAVVYTGAPTADQALIDPGTGDVTLGEAIAAADTVTVSYLVDASHAVLVTLQLGRSQETYTVVDGNDLVNQLSASAWVTAAVGPHVTELPTVMPVPPNQLPPFAVFKGGVNGEAAQPSDYQVGLDALLTQPAHIIVAAGQDDSFGNRLDAHCQKASTDAIKRDRIGIVGSRPQGTTNLETWFDQIIGHNLDSDRIIFTAPGIRAGDTPTGQEVTLSGAYTAAAFAGLLSSFDPEVSPTNKVLPVDELEAHFDSAHLTLLLQNRVLALESRQGFHVVRGITTTTGGAFAQITTRRIVDYAKFGVRSAADPYIGLLNNERVRSALRATLNSFLGGMVEAEMLESYDVSVTATRAQEIQGIVDVTMTLQPVFSIDFIQVTMFLQ